MIVVSDTQPVLNLARIGRLDLLPLLDRQVLPCISSPAAGTSGPRGILFSRYPIATSGLGLLRARLAQLPEVEVSKRSMPNMQNPNGLTQFIYLVDNPIDVFALTEVETPDLP